LLRFLMSTWHCLAVLKPLEPAKQRDSMEVAGDVAVITAEDLEEHVLPGGVGTFSIRQVPDGQLKEESVAVSRMEVAQPWCSVSTMWQDSGIDKRSRGKITIHMQVHRAGSDADCYDKCSGSRAEGRSSGSSADQEPNSPRSKHSTTEQRRRTKINDMQAN
jgi:hypothetical protein